MKSIYFSHATREPSFGVFFFKHLKVWKLLLACGLHRKQTRLGLAWGPQFTTPAIDFQVKRAQLPLLNSPSESKSTSIIIWRKKLENIKCRTWMYKEIQRTPETTGRPYGGHTSLHHPSWGETEALSPSIASLYFRAHPSYGAPSCLSICNAKVRVQQLF